MVKKCDVNSDRKMARNRWHDISEQPAFYNSGLLLTRWRTYTTNHSTSSFGTEGLNIFLAGGVPPPFSNGPGGYPLEFFRVTLARGFHSILMYFIWFHRIFEFLNFSGGSAGGVPPSNLIIFLEGGWRERGRRQLMHFEPCVRMLETRCRVDRYENLITRLP